MILRGSQAERQPAEAGATIADSNSRPVVVGVGVSFRGFCGIRDYWSALAECLTDSGWLVESAWWERNPAAQWKAAGLRAWALQLSGVRGGDASALLWNYSVFGYAARGVPLFVPVVAWQVRRTGIPITVLLHEFGFPWWWPRWRGKVFAVAHRVALFAVLAVSSRVIVTTESRAEWIRSQRWLPRRPCAVVPVFSPLSPETTPPARVGSCAIGVFGYGARRMRADVVVEALLDLVRQGRQVKLLLVGGDGAGGPGGKRWTQAARDVGCERYVEFTGPLAPRHLSQTLADLSLLVFPDEAGASSRKTTLATALAHGKCVVALSGPDEWSELRDHGAVAVVPPESGGLAAEVARLLDDDVARRSQEERAAAFYRAHMAPSLVADEVISFATSEQR